MSEAFVGQTGNIIACITAIDNDDPQAVAKLMDEFSGEELYLVICGLSFFALHFMKKTLVDGETVEEALHRMALKSHEF